MIILYASPSAGQPRARRVPRQDAADDGRAGGHLPLNLCTHSTRHSVDTSACIRTTSWLQQSGVYRRQTACALIVVSGELVALSSLAQHRCRSCKGREMVGRPSGSGRSPYASRGLLSRRTIVAPRVASWAPSRTRSSSTSPPNHATQIVHRPMDGPSILHDAIGALISSAGIQ